LRSREGESCLGVKGGVGVLALGYRDGIGMGGIFWYRGGGILRQWGVEGWGNHPALGSHLSSFDAELLSLLGYAHCAIPLVTSTFRTKSGKGRMLLGSKGIAHALREGAATTVAKLLIAC